jgi:hypothetical protein
MYWLLDPLKSLNIDNSDRIYYAKIKYMNKTNLLLLLLLLYKARFSRIKSLVFKSYRGKYSSFSYSIIGYIDTYLTAWWLAYGNEYVYVYLYWSYYCDRQQTLAFHSADFSLFFVGRTINKSMWCVRLDKQRAYTTQWKKPNDKDRGKREWCVCLWTRTAQLERFVARNVKFSLSPSSRTT